MDAQLWGVDVVGSINITDGVGRRCGDGDGHEGSKDDGELHCGGWVGCKLSDDGQVVVSCDLDYRLS